MSYSQIRNDSGGNFSADPEFALWSGEGYNGELHFAEGVSLKSASWTFPVPPVGTHRVSVTWVPHENRATNAKFSVMYAGNVLGVVLVNQQLAPNDFQDGGVGWKILGNFAISLFGSDLVIKLVNEADGFVIADAVRVDQVS